MKKVKITIGKDGSVKAEAEGFKGDSCEKATEFLNSLFGDAAEVKHKASYYEENDEVKINDGLPSGWCG